jgi:hypothetical protein
MAMSNKAGVVKRWKDRETSPDRNIVWTEPPIPIKHKKVPVVYYLCRNGQLEHPHFMEVPLSSSHGLYLKDVINRLTLLRGNGMADLYSWSSKRSYKNGFVWHDLVEEDFIYPAHGHEYVLKGSELVNSSSFRLLENQNQKPVEESDSPVIARRRNREIEEEKINEISELNSDEISPPPSDSSPETLESLMKADGRLVVLEPAAEIPASSRLRGSSVLMQLIACGSMSFRDCGPGAQMRTEKNTAEYSSCGNGRMKIEEKEYFSGSIIEAQKKECPVLKRSSSCNADRLISTNLKP